MATFEIQGPDGRTYEIEAPSQEAAIAAFQQFQGSQPQPVSTSEDVGRGFLGGAISGVGALLDLPSIIGRAPMQLSDRFLGTNMLEGISAPTPFVEALGEVAPSIEQAAGYDPQTIAGGYAQTAGEFLPGAVFTPGGPLARLGLGVVAPAIGSETAGLAAEGLGMGETAQGIARLAGAVAAPVAAERGLRALVSPTGGTSPVRVAAAETLRQADVPITAGQQSGSGILRRLEGAEAPSEEQLEALTRAALRTIGAEGTRATDDVLNAASNRIGGVFDDVTQNLSVQVDPQRINDFATAASTYRQLAPTEGRAPIIDDIFRSLNAGRNITGNQIMTWRSNLSRLTRSNDTATRTAAVEALEVVDNIIEDSLAIAGRSDDVARINTARQQWRDFLAIQRAAGQGGEMAAEGLLTPGGLRIGVQGQNLGQYVRGNRGDLGDITRAAQSVMASSPTVLPGGVRAVEGAGRAITTGLGTAVGGAAGAPLVGGAIGFALPEISRAAITSAPLQSYLRNQLAAPYAARLSPAQRMMLYGPAALSAPNQQ